MRLFETTTELKFDTDDAKRKAAGSKAIADWLGTKIGHINKSSISQNNKNDNFYFRPSKEYDQLLLSIGIHKSHGFFYDSIVSNMLGDIIEVDFNSISDYAEDDWRELNNDSILHEEIRFDYEYILTVISSLECGETDIIENAISLNDYAKTNYEEAYLPFLNELANKKLNELE